MSEVAVKVNGDVSDIFFNMDHRPEFDDKGNGDYMDLKDNAELLSGALRRMGAADYTPDELIADFYARI